MKGPCLLYFHLWPQSKSRSKFKGVEQQTGQQSRSKFAVDQRTIWRQIWKPQISEYRNTREYYGCVRRNSGTEWYAGGWRHQTRSSKVGQQHIAKVWRFFAGHLNPTFLVDFYTKQVCLCLHTSIYIIHICSCYLIAYYFHGSGWK